MGPVTVSRTPRTAPLRGAAWSLEAALAVAALSEFVLFRLLRLLLPASAANGQGGGIGGALAFAGSYALNLTAVLSVLVTALLLMQALGPRGLGRNPVGRTGIALMSAVFVPLSLGLVLLPGTVSGSLGLLRAQWLTHTAGVCLSVLTLLAVLPSRYATRRQKLALGLLLFPPLMLMENQWGVLSSRTTLRSYTLWLMLYGPIAAAALVGVGALMLVSPALARLQRVLVGIAGAGAVLIAGGFGVLLLLRRPAASKIALSTFDLHLPQAALPQVVVALALGAWVFAALALLTGEPRERRQGIGLLLIGLAGAQPRAAYQLGMHLTGLLCIAESLVNGPLPARAPARTPETAPPAPAAA